MKIIPSLSLILLLSSQSVFIQASSLDPLPQKYTQPNGTSFSAITYGDAWFHWKETLAGLVIVLNKKTGYYEYAVIREINGQKMLRPSGVQIEANAKPGTHSFAFDAVRHKDIQPLRQAALKKKKKNSQLLKSNQLKNNDLK